MLLCLVDWSGRTVASFVEQVISQRGSGEDRMLFILAHRCGRCKTLRGSALTLGTVAPFVHRNPGAMSGMMDGGKYGTNPCDVGWGSIDSAR